jgi:hypothetical protein
MRLSLLLAGSFSVLSASACSRRAAEVVDAGVVAVSTPDSGAGLTDAAVGATATAALAPASTATPATPAAAASTGGPFQGSFPACLTGGLKTSQSGIHVVGHSGDSYNQKVGHDVINFSCTVSGTECTGTATTVSKSDTGKITPHGPPHKMKFTRAADGSFQFFQDGQPAPSMCGKPS